MDPVPEVYEPPRAKPSALQHVRPSTVHYPSTTKGNPPTKPTTPQAFHCFPRLPPEIRRLIWLLTMPRIRPAMYYFSWRWYVAYMDPESNIAALDDYRGRPMVQAPTPTALFVSHEARGAALEWAHKMALRLVLRKETNGHMLVRTWNPKFDILFIPRECWPGLDRLWNEVPLSRAMGRSIINICIPVAPSFASGLPPMILGSFRRMPNMMRLHLLWGEVPVVHSTGKSLPAVPHIQSYYRNTTVECDIQPRWEVTHELGPMVEAWSDDRFGRSAEPEIKSLDEMMNAIFNATTTAPDGGLFDAPSTWKFDVFPSKLINPGNNALS